MEQLHPDSKKLILEATDDKTSPRRLRYLAKSSRTLTPLVAANPNANPELLAELARKKDKKIRQAVAANPNTPTEVLWQLGEEFPEKVLNNPVFSLLLLENPNLVERIPENTLLNFLKSPVVPVSFIEWAVDNSANNIVGTLSFVLTMNPQTPQPVLEKLISKDCAVEEARLHVNFPEREAQNLEKAIGVSIETLLHYEGYKDVIGEDWEFLAEIGVIPLVFLEVFANDERNNLRRRAARSYLLSDRYFEKLALDLDMHVRFEVARNPSTPVKVLKQLAKDVSLDVRLSVAENPNVPASILEELGRDRCDSVRRAVAENFNTPATVFEELAKDRDKSVRNRVAVNPRVPVDLLEQLAMDAELVVAVASNANTPAYLLDPIARRYRLERYEELRRSFAINPNTSSYLLDILALDKDVLVRENVAKNPHTSRNTLERLALEKDERIQLAIATNPNAPINALEKLARHPQYLIRRTVAANPSTPVDVLERLGRGSHSINSIVQALVAAHPNAPFHFVEEFLSSSIEANGIIELKVVKRFLAEKPDGFPQLLELFAAKFPMFSAKRWLILLHPEVSPRVLVQNCQSLAWLERCAIAKNPNIPTDTLWILAKDGNRIVRAAAREKLSDRAGR